LSRAGRSIEAWTTALASVVPHGGQYRQSITLDRLLVIAANPAADAEIRAAAAAAASPALDTTTRARLADVALQAADESLRASLTQIATAHSRTDVEAALIALSGLKAEG